MEKKTDNSEEKSLLGVAFLSLLLNNRKYRRNLLFSSTIVTMLLVFVGAVFLVPFLSKHPVGFVFYWLTCFVMVGFVLILALYDLLRIRKEHRVRMSALDRELASAAEEARRLAAEAKSEGGEGGEARSE